MDQTPPPRKRPDAARPSIWAEGSQKPRFNARAFALASLFLSREAVAPLLGKVSGLTSGLSTSVASGKYRMPADKLGRAGRLVPSHGRVAGWIGGGADILGRAGQAVAIRPATPAAAPPAQPARNPSGTAPRPEPRAFPTDRQDLADTPPGVSPARPRARQDEAASPTEGPAPVVLQEPASPHAPDNLQEDDRDTLMAIRSAIGTPPDLPTGSTEGAAAGTATTTAQPQADPGKTSATLRGVAGTALGWGLTVAALPYGAVRAALAHLNGVDLRGITDDR